jgi:hypothetical protein
MDNLAERIRARAYELWEQAGRPQDRSDEFWYKARQELAGDAAAESERPAASFGLPLDVPVPQPQAIPAPVRAAAGRKSTPAAEGGPESTVTIKRGRSAASPSTGPARGSKGRGGKR